MSIYLSLYQDGVYRQRCQKHIDAAPAKRMGAWKVWEATTKITCPVCWWEKQQKGGEGNVEQEEGLVVRDEVIESV